jgi:hypothetical protein
MRGLPTITLCAGLVLLSGAAQAAEPRELGSFDAWAAYELREPSGKVCYVYAEPQSAKGDYTKRGPTYVQVTHRPAAKATNEVGVTAGYPYKADSEVEVDIDGTRFSLFTSGDTAWARDSKDDAALAAAMRAGITMVVRGTSARGTLTTDTYSLKGFTAAHNAIGKACGVR